MLKLIGWRVARTIPLLLLVSLAVFGLVLLIPGDPASAIAGDAATPQQIQAIRSQLGLDQPILVQYAIWLRHLISGDLGVSLYSGVPVAQSIGERFPVTFSLAAAALVVALVLGIPTGIVAATRRGSGVDRVITVLSTFGIAIPAFWLGLLLTVAFALQLQILPAVGYVPLEENLGEWARHLALPALTLGAVGAAELARHTRSALYEALQQDYVRTAQAVGLRRPTVVLRSALKNAAVPILTIASFQISFLLGGAVVVEQVFSLNGIGTLAIASVGQKDLPVLQGVVMVAAAVVVTVNLLTDIAYGLIDPRVRFA